MTDELIVTTLFSFLVMFVISIILSYIAQKTKHLRIGDD